MVTCRQLVAMGFVLVFGISLLAIGIGHAGEQSGTVGWEKDSAYNKLYNLDEWDSFKGKVVGVKQVTPLPGMAPGVALLIQDSENEMVTVHLGPLSFINPNSIGVRKGEKVNVKGVWAEIDGKDVFMASKVKKADSFELKVRRTKDGTPCWTMSPEELAREREGK